MKYKISAILICLLYAVNASSASIERAFGGQIISVQPCTCPFAAISLLTVKNHDGRILQLSYIPYFSRLYLSYNYLGAINLLGSYNPALRFQCYSGSDCEPRYDDGTLGAMPGTGFSQ